MAIKFLLDLLTTIIVALFVLRFLLQLTRADFYNPASQAIVKFTNPLVMPLRKVIPGWGGLDLASIVAALVLQAAALLLLFAYDAGLRGFPMPPWTLIALRTPIELVLLTLQLYVILIFLRILMSWLNPDPRNPAMSILFSLTEPLLRPARRVVPPIGGFDLSPILVLIALQFLHILIGQDLF